MGCQLSPRLRLAGQFSQMIDFNYKKNIFSQRRKLPAKALAVEG
jgi:hypothetical protein